MEQQVLQLLEATTSPNSEAIRNAEHSLKSQYPSSEFPFALLNIASHHDIAIGLRQASLLQLKQYVGATWSPSFDDDFKGSVYLNDEAKSRLRQAVFVLATNEGVDGAIDHKINTAAASVTSKIATADFPESWPELLPNLLQIITGTGADLQVHGALRVLSELVDSGFTEEQFFAAARDLVSGLQNVATNNNRSPIVRAMAMSVFRACFDMLEMVMEDHKVAVKGFLDESLQSWMPFFVETIKSPLPSSPSKDDELKGDAIMSQWRGSIALKLQVVKTFEKIKAVYVQALTPHVVILFEAVWEELSRIAPTYREFFIDDDRQGKLEDADGLPYTLDFLVLEEIDFLQMSFRAPGVKTELEKQLNQAPGGRHTVGWLQELFKLLLTYAQIPSEEVELWEYDPNLYLSEATSITANYTPRAACADLVIRGLSEWLRMMPIDAILFYCQQNLAAQVPNWKEPEAILFILNQLLRDVGETSNQLSDATASGLLQQVSKYIGDKNMFLQGASHFVAASLFQIVGNTFTEPANSAFQAAVHAITVDGATNNSDLVKIVCLKIVQDYLQAPPVTIASSMQPQIIAAVHDFVGSHDLRDELEDADDIKACLIETLRDTIAINPASALEGPALDLLFTLGSDGAANFQLFQLVTESFENIVSSVATDLGHDAYVVLCGKTIPALSGAFDVANMTQESALTNLAAELVSALAEYGSQPLPDGFVAALMPKLNRVLMEGTEAELVRPATLAVQHMLAKGSVQFLQWTDSTGKSAVEVTLTIINRLLNSPDVDESAATEVGGLATELIMKAGIDKLGTYLMELMRAVAVRLATASRAQFIQSLLMVFAGLTTEAPTEIVEFLTAVDINGQNGLTIVLAKWLENSINFAGFDEIRQNVMALSKLYALNDPRIAQIAVKGDLVVDNTGRIKTRSQAKLNPDRYTSIPANLKILKILVEELSSAATNKYQNPADAAAALDSEGSDDGDDWEDVGAGSGGGTLDLGSGLTKSQLMAYANEDDGASMTSRVRDDETAEYLVGWFRGEAGKPGFSEMFDALNEEEKAKLQTLV